MVSRKVLAALAAVFVVAAGSQSAQGHKQPLPPTVLGHDVTLRIVRVLSGHSFTITTPAGPLKVRAHNFDAPSPNERGAQCAEELELGRHAKRTLEAILNQPPGPIRTVFYRHGKFGHNINSVTVNGIPLLRLMRERGASVREWDGRIEGWCEEPAVAGAGRNDV